MNQAQASRLRQQIARLRDQRAAVELQLLKRRRMLRASLLERYLGQGDAKRKTPAYYLSFLREGRIVQRYVRQEDWSGILPRARSWSEYYHLLARWGKLNRQMAAIWRELGQAQADEPGAS